MTWALRVDFFRGFRSFKIFALRLFQEDFSSSGCGSKLWNGRSERLPGLAPGGGRRWMAGNRSTAVALISDLALRGATFLFAGGNAYEKSSFECPILYTVTNHAPLLREFRPGRYPPNNYLDWSCAPRLFPQCESQRPRTGYKFDNVSTRASSICIAHELLVLLGAITSHNVAIQLRMRYTTKQSSLRKLQHTQLNEKNLLLQYLLRAGN